MSEAWRDDNEDGVHNDGEIFLDFNNDNLFSAADEDFNGPVCQGDFCPTENKNSLHIRKALTLIMSSSSAIYKLSNSDDNTVYADNTNDTNIDIPPIAEGSAQNFTFSFSDTAQQVLPIGTTLTLTSSVGKLLGTTSSEILNTNQVSGLSFSIINDASVSADTGELEITIQTPKGTITSLFKIITIL
jgi:hypothetical protein